MSYDVVACMRVCAKDGHDLTAWTWYVLLFTKREKFCRRCGWESYQQDKQPNLVSNPSRCEP